LCMSSHVGPIVIGCHQLEEERVLKELGGPHIYVKRRGS
jgi:hypothetical protein